MEGTLHEYYFYHMNDSNREKIAKMIALTEEDAVTVFATNKGLDVDEFRKIYSVGKSEPIPKRGFGTN